MLVVPDVHGRTFWKEALRDNQEEEVIFLGDYLDPYPDEGITPDEALEIFKEIIEIKKENPQRITLLLGNHDLSYIDREYSCRHDWEHDKEISKLITDNKDLFRLAARSGKFVFSHSGIHPVWLRCHSMEFGSDIKSSVKAINSKLWDPSTLESLMEISIRRGGWKNFGSPIWSDVREWIGYDWSKESGVEDITQIFGHTQLKEGKIIDEGLYACIDCKHVCKIINEKIEVL